MSHIDDKGKIIQLKIIWISFYEYIPILLIFFEFYFPFMRNKKKNIHEYIKVVFKFGIYFSFIKMYNSPEFI